MARCIAGGKEKATTKCIGCSGDFCFNHLVEHRQQLKKQLDELENKRHFFQQIVTEKKEKLSSIQQTADQAEELLRKQIDKIEVKLIKLTEEFQEIREENDFNEIDLNELKEKLKQLEEELNKPSNISIEGDSSSSINKVPVVNSSGSLSIPNIGVNARWMPNGIRVAGGSAWSNDLDERSTSPSYIHLGDDQTIYVADRQNHCIVEWKGGATIGEVVAGGHGPGKRRDQLDHPVNVIIDKLNDCFIIADYNNKRVVRWPRQNGTCGETIISNVTCWGLAIDNDGYIYVSDSDKCEVRRWKIGDLHGTLVAGGNGAGDRFDQLCYPKHIFVDQDHSVYVSDSQKNSVMKWTIGAKAGIVVAGGQGRGDHLAQLAHPTGLIVGQLGTVYVVDDNNHRIMRWLKGDTEGSIVLDGDGSTESDTRFISPCDLSFDKQNNLYVLYSGVQGVLKFLLDPS